MSKPRKKPPQTGNIIRYSDTWGLPGKRKGAFVEFEVDVDEKTGKVVKFRIVYINPMVYAGDNGRVLGYDDSHDWWHRHFLGETTPIEEMSYEEIIDTFRQDLHWVLEQENLGKI